MDQPLPPIPPIILQTPVVDSTPVVVKKPFPKWPIYILIFVFGIASVFAYQKYQPTGTVPAGSLPSPFVSLESSAEKDDPTANWKIYTNKANNYQLLFPQDWTLDDITSPAYPEIIPPNEGPNNEGRIVIAVIVASGSLNQFMEAINPSTGGKNSDTYAPVRQIQISGENGILTKGGCCGFFGQHAFFQYQNKIYQISLKGPIDNPQEKFQRDFDLILSTFKFSEPTS